MGEGRGSSGVMKRVITSGGGYGYAPETHLYYVVVVLSKGVQMRLQLSDVCGEGRVVAGASGYEFMLTMFCSQMYRCVDDVNACLVLVHLRRGSYLLAPTTIDPSRINNTASSRFPSRRVSIHSIARVFP